MGGVANSDMAQMRRLVAPSLLTIVAWTTSRGRRSLNRLAAGASER
jgi:hypothetical protein